MNKHPFHLFNPKFCQTSSISRRSLKSVVREPAGNCRIVEKYNSPVSAASFSEIPGAVNLSLEVKDLLPWVGWVSA